MAYDYLGLVNDVNNRLNEVELTSTNFTTATGYFSFAKDAVNAALRHINQEEYKWPWNHVEETETLRAGTVRYSYPDDSKTIDMDSFRIKRDDSLNVGSSKLKIQNISDETKNKLVKFEFQKMVLEDKLNTAFPNLDVWLAESFNRLNIIMENHINDR